MAGDGIIRINMVVNNTSVKDMTRLVDELTKKVTDLQTVSKGQSVQFDGMVMGLKELQAFVKKTEADLKALQGMSSKKSDALDGMKKGADETTEKFRSLKQAVNDAVTAMDKAHQSSSGTAKYDGKTMNITQLTEAHSKALANLASMESSLAGNREKALQYEQKLRSDIAAKELADRQKYQSYLDKNVRHDIKESNSGDRRATMANLLDERGQNKAYSGYYGNMAKSINAELNAADKVMDAYKASQIKMQNDIVSAKERINVAANNKYYTDQTKQSQENSDNLRRQMETRVKLENDTANLIGKQNANASKQYWVDQETLIKQRSSQLQGWMQGQQRGNEQSAESKAISDARTRTAIATDQRYYDNQDKRIKSTSDAIRTRMESEVKQQNTKFNNEQSQITKLTAEYNKLYNGIASSITKNRQLSEQAFNAVKDQASIKGSQLSTLNASPMNAGKLSSMDYSQYSAQFQQSYQGYARSVSAARQEAERLHQVMTLNNNAQTRLDFKVARDSLQHSVKLQDQFNASIGIGGDRVGQLNAFMTKFQSHARWIMAGAAIGALVAIPTGALQTLKEVELGMAGIQQVLPQLHADLAKVTKGSEEYLVIQQKLNKESIAIIALASQYGLAVNDIVESYKLWARGYKDTDMVRTLVESAAVLSKADNFSMVEANKAIEGIMLQFGVRVSTMEEAAKASMKIVDSITNVSHNAMVSAQDLAAANIRSASAAKQAGVSFDFLQGMIGTMARNTGRAGGEIGNAIRSMLVSIHSDKAVAEIEKMGVAMYKVGKDGTKSFRDVEEVIVDLMLVSDSTDKNIEKMMLSISGGERKLAA